MSNQQKKIAIVGGGNMGAAILEGIHKKYSVIVCESDATRASFLKKKYKVSIGSLNESVERSDIVILAVKPQQFDEVLSQIKFSVTTKKLFVSIAAGITTKYIEKKLGTNAKVIRTMPNLPAQIGMAMTALTKGKKATASDLDEAQKIFDLIGGTVLVGEKMIDAITAVSGSGPAYVFLFVECMMAAAQKLGLKKDDAQKLVFQTMRGSLALLERSTEDASVLRQRVTSKGGTTQAALDVFFANKFSHIFKEALTAARDRARELSK